MSKAHWNTVAFQSDVSDDEIKQMIDLSYNLVVKSLPKKLKTDLEIK